MTGTGVGTLELALEGGSRLAEPLSRAARHHGHSLTDAPREDGEAAAEARLTCRRDGRTAASTVLEPDNRLARAIAEDALWRLMRAWPGGGAGEGGRAASAVVLAPAGSVAGPADAGPVDAVVMGDHWVAEESGTRCAVRLLTAQQTRCWVVSYSCEDATGERPGAPIPGIEIVPAWIARDTARLCEYMLDRGAGDDWPELLQLGEPQYGPGGRAGALFAFTEAAYARRLVASLLAEARPA
ncbi:hypothetical protein ACWGLF_41925 [Streptomyces puniciscabiei]